MSSKKRKEAFRLKKQFEKDFSPAKAKVIRLSQYYLVSIQIKGKPFSYRVTLDQLKGSAEQRNLSFAKFIVDSMIYASKVVNNG